MNMRKNIVAGNWKMNTTVPEGIELAKAVVAKASEVPASVKLIIAPPFTHLYPVAEVVKGSVVGLSAQNCADKEKGAYTGEVSVKMLSSTGCEYTILGHSERRLYYGETDATLVEKVKLEPARLQLLSRLRKSTHASARCLPRNSVHSQRKSLSSTAEAASRQMPRNSSHARTSTEAS